MRVLDLLLSSVQALSTNKLRSGLTALGIIIGVGAVVAMMSLTTGLDRYFTEQFSSLGSNTIEISKMPRGGHRHRDWAILRKRKDIKVDDAKAIAQLAPAARFVGAELWQRGQSVYSLKTSATASVALVGGTPVFTANNSFEIAQGRSINSIDLLHARQVAVIGPDVARTLFPHSSPLQGRVRLAGRQFEVIGVFASRGSFFGMGSRDNCVLIPITTCIAIFGKNRSIDITVQANDPAEFAQAEDQATQVMRMRRQLKPEQENDFEVFSNQSRLDQVNQITDSVAAAAIAIAMISLIVGGIGIMNIMLVSVTERTREIGVRRALGARKRNILMQFTVEAVILAVLGGLLGLWLGATIAHLSDVLVGLPAVVPAWAVVVALLTSSVTGLVFGIYPAWRASQLDPIDALHYE